MEVVRHRCLLNERIIDALMVNGRRCSSTIRPIVAHDKVFLNRANASRKADLAGRDPLKVVAVFRPGDLVDILFGAVEENQKRRDSVYGTQNGPIGLAEPGK